MKKSDIIAIIAGETDGNKAAALRAYDAITNRIKLGLAAGETIRLDEIGTLRTRIIAGRNHRNPRTGEQVFKPTHTGIKFNVSSKLNEAVNPDAE